MKLFCKFAAILAAAVIAGVPIRTSSRYDVTVDVGICQDDAGNGKVIAAAGYDYDPNYSYISYSGTDARPGDMVLTVCYIRPGTVDDILQRVDYLISPAH